MIKLLVMINIVLLFCFNFNSAFCDVGLYNSHSDSSSHKSTQSSTMIIRYVIGSGGILGSSNSSKTHSATTGETFVGFMQGNNNLLLSGFWQPGIVFTNIDEKKVNYPITFALFQNHPNPFNPQTSIQYDLPGEYLVIIEIFNIAGQRVRLLIDNEIEGPGAKETIWNGLDDTGDILCSGVYLCRIQCQSTGSDKDFHDTIKMLLVR